MAPNQNNYSTSPGEKIKLVGTTCGDTATSGGNADSGTFVLSFNKTCVKIATARTYTSLTNPFDIGLYVLEKAKQKAAMLEKSAVFNINRRHRNNPSLPIHNLQNSRTI